MIEKVLVIATTFPRWINDTTPGFVYELSNRIAARYKIIVLAPHYNKASKRENMGKLEIRRFAYFKPESLQKLCYEGGIIPNMKKSFLAKIQMPLLVASEFFTSYRIVKKDHINMIHAHWILPQGFVGVFLKKLLKIPLLVTIHGSDLFPLKNKLLKKLQNFVMKNSDYVTVNSNATRNELVQRFPNYISKIKVIPMGVDVNLFKKRKVRKPKQYTKNKILLFVGRLSDQKGLQYLIDSMPEIIKYDSKVKLLIIGEGPYGKILQEKSHNNKIEKHVEFLGSMSVAKISKYYNFADIFVMPSLSTKTGTEALGLSLLEAMASGCAVVGTNVGGIPFVIKNNYNGILIRQKDHQKLSNAIIALLKNRKKSIKLGNNAAEFIRKNYSWDKISKEFIKIYGDLLK
ncbi:MAG: glycosyltransferase family 4 protein [Nanoarchaeota archaeon]|nr:glycosyltransferase family 4 protein [Nanoarchaeota archaeon]